MSACTLDKFKERRALWIRCFDGEDRHSIMRQIYRMIWNTAAFRVINEARRIAPPAEKGTVQLNGLMHDLIDEGFFEGQLLAIRRLTDTYPITDACRGRNVWSLTSLFDDIKKHAHLMTRVNLLAAEGLEYDVDSVRQQANDYLIREFQKSKMVFTPPELDWERPQMRHEQIDFLSGVSAKHRSPDDIVSREVIEQLKEMVKKACNNIHIHVNQFIAHAATPESRHKVNAQNASITLGHLYNAQEAICKAATFLDLYLLTGHSHGLLAVPQYDHFAHVDKPLVTTEGIAMLRDAWEKYDAETTKWANWGIEEFGREFPLRNYLKS
jgi:hypothetical protein